jgi:hypothetical protein
LNRDCMFFYGFEISSPSEGTHQLQALVSLGGALGQIG